MIRFNNSTIGKEKTATERLVPKKKGINFIPKVFAAKREVRYKVKQIKIFL